MKQYALRRDFYKNGKIKTQEWIVPRLGVWIDNVTSRNLMTLEEAKHLQQNTPESIIEVYNVTMDKVEELV